MDENGEN